MLNKLFSSLKKPNLIPRIWKKLLSYFFLEQWIILAAKTSASHETIQWQDFDPILPPADRDWADPFPWFHNGKYYLFIEEKLYSTNIGRIICLTLDEKLKIASSQVILERPYHLSYPFLFEHKSQLYMIPESNANSTVDLYKCTSFPDKWEFVKTLLPVKAVDATLLEKDGKWWLFANVFDENGSSWNTLHLFMADDPIADSWKPHPKNPIVKDVNSARPAGRFFQFNGELIRPSQDCSVRYGYATNFNRVIVLDETSYEEVRTRSFKPPQTGIFLAAHTWNEKNGVIMIDAIYRRRKPINIQRFRT